MKRISPEREIIYISNVIEKNIEANKVLKDRGLLSQNILSQLRNFVEDTAILINNKKNSLDLDTHYENVNSSIKYVASKKEYRDISKFYDYLQSTASHYTPNDGDAERLIVYYYRYMVKLKEILKSEFDLDVFRNLDDFPIYEDYLMKEHYDAIAQKIEEVRLKTNSSLINGRFYVQKIKPIYSNSKLYYEVTLTKATDYANKFERITMYSKFYIPDNYSIKLSFVEKKVNVLSNETEIKIIDNYIISVRPCELNNIAKIINYDVKIEDKYIEYTNLMQILCEEEINLLEFISLNHDKFVEFIQRVREGAKNHNLVTLLQKLRAIIVAKIAGVNILSYLLVKMDNIVIKSQLDNYKNSHLSNLRLSNACIPFDSMPFAMSLRRFNTSWKHLIQAVDMKDREHELLARFVKNNCETNNVLYTLIDDIPRFDDIDSLVEKYNQKLLENGIVKSGDDRSNLILEHNYIYIKSYESDSINIINKLSEYNDISDKDTINNLNTKLYTYSDLMDLTDDKVAILKKMLRKQKIALIHGPAGTGKTKMIEVLTHIFKDYKKIYLANTNTAINNIERRISNEYRLKSEFQTVRNYIYNNDNKYEILILDECSAISNSDMAAILNKQDFKVIVLSGDIHQIEAIKYGNWFSLAYNYFKNDFVYELNKNNRTTDDNLLELWQLVRDSDEHAISKINSCEYASEIDETIFERNEDSEIVLCLNYDGLYGINNINKILQEKNVSKGYKIGVDVYKINDPVVFNDCPRFYPVLTNNTKGYLREIVVDREQEVNWFTVEVEGFVVDLFDEVKGLETLEYSKEKDTTMVRFFVRFFKDTNDDDNDFEHIILFNLAYAVSIHKAQGLEYKSVKIVITSNIEDRITKNIFYTAITRAKEKLKIYWSSESQNKIFDNFKKRVNSKDISILKTKL